MNPPIVYPVSRTPSLYPQSTSPSIKIFALAGINSVCYMYTETG